MAFSIHGLAVARGIAIGRAGEPAVMSVEEGRRKLRLPKKMEGAAPVAPSQPVPGVQE